MYNYNIYNNVTVTLTRQHTENIPVTNRQYDEFLVKTDQRLRYRMLPGATRFMTKKLTKDYVTTSQLDNILF